MSAVSRRTFLAQSALAVATANRLRAAEPKPAGPEVIDTHVHLWDLKQFDLPWLKPDAPFAKNFLFDDYRKATAGANLKQAVYMEVDVAEKQKKAEAEWIRGVCKKGNTLIAAAVIGGYPAAPGFAEYVKAYKDDPYIKGVRQVVHAASTPAGFCLKKEFIAGVRLLGELGLSFDLCMRPAELPDATKLIDACPGTRFVLDHCGNPDLRTKDHTAWKRDLADLAKRKNVVGKVSGILFTAKKGWTADDLAPVIEHTLDSFGSDRVLYAADWPVCLAGGTWQQWFDAVRAVVKGRKAEEQQKLFAGNARKFYGLK